MTFYSSKSLYNYPLWRVTLSVIVSGKNNLCWAAANEQQMSSSYCSLVTNCAGQNTEIKTLAPHHVWADPVNSSDM